MAGYIFNMQRFCVSDGPGIRTTVFLKGCPLSCWWCHNPESQRHNPQLSFSVQKCVGCFRCLPACKSGALQEGQGCPTVRREMCQHCGACSAICPSEALQLIGQQVTADEVMAEVLKDRAFYEESGGGVTFSGGEPLCQAEFLYALLLAAQFSGLHTAVDTSGYAPWSVLAKVSSVTDLFLYDVKHMDTQQHQKLTGAPNDLILSNLRQLTKTHSNVMMRVPVIPGWNDSHENLSGTRDLALGLGIRRIHLLPYHAIGTGKCEVLSITSPVQRISPLGDQYMAQLAEFFGHPDLEVKIGG